MFQWLSHFLAMGGYAKYVWPSYGLVFVVLAFYLIRIKKQHKQLLQQLQEAR